MLVAPLNDDDLRLGSRPGAGDHVGLAVAVHVAGGDGDAALERRAERGQRLEQPVRLRVVDLHLRRRARRPSRRRGRRGRRRSRRRARPRRRGLNAVAYGARASPPVLPLRTLTDGPPWPAAMSATPSWFTSPSASEIAPVYAVPNGASTRRSTWRRGVEDPDPAAPSRRRCAAPAGGRRRRRCRGAAHAGRRPRVRARPGRRRRWTRSSRARSRPRPSACGRRRRGRSASRRGPPRRAGGRCRRRATFGSQATSWSICEYQDDW